MPLSQAGGESGPQTGGVRVGPPGLRATPAAPSVCAGRWPHGAGKSLLLSSSRPPFSGPRKSAGPTRRPKARERALTAAVSTMRAVVTPKTSTRTIAAHPPASPALRTTRVTRTPLPNSRCCRPSLQPCRPPAGLLHLPRPHQEPPSFPRQGPRPPSLRSLHRAPPRPPSLPARLQRLQLLTLIPSRPPPCTHSGCLPHTPHCSL